MIQTFFLTRDTQPRSISQWLAFFLEDAQVVCGCLGMVRSDEIQDTTTATGRPFFLWRQTQLDESCLECGQVGFGLLTETQLEHPRLQESVGLMHYIKCIRLKKRRYQGDKGALWGQNPPNGTNSSPF